MFETIVISAILLIIAILFLGVRVFFVKGGRFPNSHIGNSKAMRDRGIKCATSQDREAQQNKKKLNTNDIINELNKQ